MPRKLDKTIWRRIFFIVVLLPICFFFPLLLLLVWFIAYGIYSDLTDPYLPSEPSWRDAKPEDKDWLEKFCEVCESPAEEHFLRAMVAEFDLKPRNGKLVSQRMTLEMQVTFANYRFDFLVNGRQVIEVDGASYHSSPEQMERDRIRDEISLEGGYKVLRIPAKVVFSMPDEVVRLVKAALAETPLYAEPQKVRREAEKKSIVQRVNLFFETIDEISRENEIGRRLVPIMAEFRSAIQLERDIFDNLVRDAEFDKKVDSMEADLRERYILSPEGQAKRGLLRRIPQYSGPYQWKKIVFPLPAEDPDLQLVVDAEVQRTIGSREEWIGRLKGRCEKDAKFMSFLCRRMVEAECPNEVAEKIVPQDVLSKESLAAIRRKYEVLASNNSLQARRP